jgi:hypothetical protein
MITGVSLRLLYLIFVRVLGPVLLMGRTALSEDTELLVLRHEVAVLRRTNPSPAWTGRTGRCSASSSRGCPRPCLAIAWSIRARSCAGTAVS